MERLIVRLAMALSLALLVASGAAAIGFAAGPETVQIKHDDKLGDILADSKGLTLYIFKKDQPGTSNCNGGCADAWPPLTLDSGEPVAPAGLHGALSLVTRQDGSHQVALDGMPLYRYAKDEDAEDTYGQGVGGVWFVAMAGGAAPAAAPSGQPAAQVAQPGRLPNTGDAPSTAPLAAALAGSGVLALGLGMALRRRRSTR